MAEDVSVRLTLNDDASPKLRQVSSAAQNASTALSNMGRSMDRAFSGSSITNLGNSLQSTFTNATSAAEGLGDAVEDALSGFDEFDTGFSNFGDGLSDAADEVDDLSEAISDAGDSMEDLSGIAEDVGDALDGISDGADSFDEIADGADDAGNSLDEMSSASDRLASAASNLIKVLAGMAIIKEVGDYANRAVEDFTDFEKGMAEVSTLLSDSTEESMGQMEAQVKQFATETGTLTTDIVPALYQAISASVPSDNVFSFLEVANKAAVGGVTDLETSVDGLTSVMNAYGQANMTAERASDVMFTAVKLGKTNFEEMSSALFNVVPTAVNAGVSFEDVAAGLATITAAGTPTSVATTQMRQMLVELSDEAKGAGQTFQQLSGKSFRQFIAEGGNVNQALDLMYGHAQETGQTIGQLFSSVEAGNAAAGLTGLRASVFAQDIAEMGNAAGATEAAYSKMTDTFAHKQDLLAAAWEDIRLDSGEALVTAMEPAVDGFLENMDVIKEPIVGFFTEIGNLLSAFAPMVPSIINGVTGALRTLGDVISPFARLVAANPDATGIAIKSIAGGLLAMKAVNIGSDLLSIASGATAASTGLGGLVASFVSNPWVLGAAAVTTAVVGVSAAVSKLHEMEVETNLKQHFGEITLDTSQIKTLADTIIPVDFTAELHAANVSFEEGAQLKADAEAKLQEINFLVWQVQNVNASVSGVTIEDIATAQSQFESKLVEALQKDAYAAQVSVKAIMAKGGLDSTQLVADMHSWFEQDMAEVSGLSSAIGNILQQALDEGALGVEASTAINILQQKMLQIVNSGREAQALALQDWLSLTTSGAALDSNTWKSVITQLDENRESQKAEEQSSYLSLLEYFETARLNGHIDEGRMNGIMEMLGRTLQNSDANALTTEMSWISNSLTDAYGTELETARTSIQESAQGEIDFINENIQSYINDGGAGFNDVQQALDNAWAIDTGFDGATQGALKDRFKSMFPTVESMREVIDNATEPLPQAFMDSYYQAMEVGAASGDKQSAYAMIARQIAGQEGGVEAFLSEMESSDLITAIPDELMTELNRAMTETANDADFSAMWSAISDAMAQDGNFDVDKFAQIMAEQGYDVSQYFAENGIEVGTGAKVNVSDIDTSQIATQIEGFTNTGVTTQINGSDFLQFEVDSGDTVWQLAEQLLPEGTADEVIAEAVGRIAEASSLADPNVINPGDILNVPMDIAVQAQDVDTSGVGEAVNEAAQEAAESAGGDGTSTDISLTADATVTAGTVDTSDAYTSMTTETQTAMSEVFDSDGSTDVTLSQTNNSASVYSEVSSDVQSKFNSAISATGTVNVTLNWHITNPTASVAVSVDGGTVTATIASAHAEGGIFDTPHYGVFAEAGPEAFIPIDGSDNAKAIWKETGERLGLIGSTPKPNMSGLGSSADGGSEVSGKSSDKNINLNINGSGKMQISSGMSKADILQVMVDNVKDVLMNILEQEILEEGDGAYEY